MFGGGNTSTTAGTADSAAPADNAMADAPSNGLTPGDEPAQAYDASGYSAANDTATPTTAAPTSAPVASDSSATQHAATPVPSPAAATTPADDLLTGGPTDDLMNIKQQALQQLSPLVGHLDQSPEEKFRTTMMLIQASDNADLVKDAYAAAQEISDEKTRAQALLDVVNEINYFTQHHDQQQ
jgi:hypothetical protein